jgi:Nucleotide-sugar transporter
LNDIVFIKEVTITTTIKESNRTDDDDNNNTTSTTTNSNTSASDNKNNNATSSFVGQQQQPLLCMRNIQLNVFSIIIAYIQNYVNTQRRQGVGGVTDYFHGFTIWVFVLVLLQGGWGLLVAAIIKYADNVVTGLATGVSIISNVRITVYNKFTRK